MAVTPTLNTGLLWFDSHLFVVSDGKIKRFNPYSSVSEWPVLDSDRLSCIALPQQGEFIAYSTKNTVTFWDTSTHTQLGLIQHPQEIRSIALSPDDQFLVIGGEDGKFTTQNLSHITDSIPLSRLHPTFQEPVIRIDDTALDSWTRDQLENTEALLTAAIPESHDPSHHQWDAALVDAEMAIKVQPSVIGYISKSIALVGKGERDKGYRACDIAFERFHSSHVTFLLLVKAIIVFMAGEHRNAISRVDDLIDTVHLNSICYVVQASMYLLLGNSQMETSDYEGAIQSFERGRAQMRHHTSRTLIVVSLISGWKFDNLGITIRQRLCDALYISGRTKAAVECFHRMKSELGEKTMYGEHRDWALDFSQRSFKELEHLGDTAVDAQRYDEAISHYSTALSLDPPSPQDILTKRIKACVATGSWKEAADNANQLITLDPFSPWGYEMKHAASLKTGDYGTAVDALEEMLSKLAQSPDPNVQQHCDQYINPSSTRTTIRKIVQQTIRHLPRVLINTTTGRLHDKADQAAAFEALPLFNELVSSMTTRIDYVRIKREVRQYFRYVMLSHKWDENEPLFQQVIHITVYDLGQSLTHDKLQTFCKIVRDDGFNWAWSDTCCINKSDHFILQEALVAMFKWYQGSAMVFVFLRGVLSPSQRGALVKSIWNTRAWTLQEYVASNVVRFYTEDWTPYLDLQLPNHKESLEVISEMEQATGVSAEQLMALRPGLSSIREKLRLASTRQTTLVEDAAYSLLGIFSVSGIPAIYGEGEGSLGRLLAHVLAGSGDVSILAWTGESGSFNSCLPARITVFNGPATSHFPPPIPDAEMERLITSVDSPLFDFDLALRLYDRLNDLPPPWFAASRMKLPCIAFHLPAFSLHRTRSGRVFRADTVAFGMLEIKTRHDLSRMNSLYLVHPWLETLLDREGM
ncbi:TPR-like protein [Imleria badia]|nr:TPR-like protein [Imleria badia]